MAEGLPDYHRPIDVAIQTMTEIVNRPKYGAAEILIINSAVGINQETWLGSIAGKGMIYGGWITVDLQGSQWNSIPILRIDNEEVGRTSFANLYRYSLTKEHNEGTYLRAYDITNQIYTVGISHGFTFETQFEILYYETHGLTPTVYARIIYALT